MFALLGNDQALFMGEIILHRGAVRGGGAQFQVAAGPEPPPRDARKQEQFLVQAAVPVQQMQVGQVQNGLVDANIPVPVVEIPPGAPLHINLGMGCQFHQPPKAARMVIVAVTEHHRIHPGQIQPQGGGIVRKSAGGAGVHKQGVAGGFHIQAQAVFMNTARCAGGVFDQGNDAHGGTLLSVWSIPV